MAKKKENALGRGLDALIGEGPSILSDGAGGESTLPIEKVEANTAQPRRNFDEETLEDLADSIREHGMLQPITVRLLDSGYYQIISGERRWRAARIAGLREVPVRIVEADDREAAELSMIENLQREDLNPMEEAEGYRQLMDRFGLTQEEAAERVGKSRPSVANSLRLLTLPEEVRKMVETETLSAGHARALAGLSDPNRQRELARQAAEEGLSVRQTEALVKKPPAAKKEAPVKNPEEVDYAAVAAKELSDRLGRGVHIVNGKRRGRLELDFYGVDDLNDLLDDLSGLKRRS